MLRKALQGLVTRAIARSETGSTVRVSAHEQDWQIWIDISDGGTPIAEADLPHAFERSFVGSSVDSTGLELATAKTIIDKLGGQVWLRSPEPVGSTITVCLPTSADQNAAMDLRQKNRSNAGDRCGRSGFRPTAGSSTQHARCCAGCCSCRSRL